MLDNAAQTGCTLLSFKSPVSRCKQQEDLVIKGLNYKIKPINDNLYKVSVLIKRNGRQYRKRETIEGKRNAERRAKEIVKDLEEKADKQISTSNWSLKKLETLCECIDFYKDTNTVKTKSTHYHLKVVNEYLGNASVTNEDEFQQLYDNFIRIIQTKVTIRKSYYSKATINRFTEAIQQVLNLCKRKKVISRTFDFEPSHFKELPRKRDIDELEVERLLTAIKKYRPYLLPIVQFALLIPSRRSELVQMRRSWVDLDNRCITIPDKYTKPDMECVKPIPPSMVEYFENISVESEFAFYRIENGVYKTLGDFKKAWYFCLKKAGIIDLRFHDTRHYSASNLVKLGISEREIMQVSGWKTNMLTTYYGNKGLSASSVVYDALKVSP